MLHNSYIFSRKIHYTTNDKMIRKDCFGDIAAVLKEEVFLYALQLKKEGGKQEIKKEFNKKC